METKQAILPLSAPVSTSILLCLGNRHNHITVCDETIFVSSMTLYQQAVQVGTNLRFLNRIFQNPNSKCLLENPKPLNCIQWAQPSRKRDDRGNAMLKQQERNLFQGPALIAAVKQKMKMKMKEIYLSKPPMGYRCEGPAARPINRPWKKQKAWEKMRCHRLMPIPRITNRIDRQMQLTPFLRSVKASREHFARCFAFFNWDAPA